MSAMGILVRDCRRLARQLIDRPVIEKVERFRVYGDVPALKPRRKPRPTRR